MKRFIVLTFIFASHLIPSMAFAELKCTIKDYCGLYGFPDARHPDDAVFTKSVYYFKYDSISLEDDRGVLDFVEECYNRASHVGQLAPHPHYRGNKEFHPIYDMGRSITDSYGFEVKSDEFTRGVGDRMERWDSCSEGRDESVSKDERHYGSWKVEYVSSPFWPNETVTSGKVNSNGRYCREQDAKKITSLEELQGNRILDNDCKPLSF